MAININEWNMITLADFNSMQFDSGFIVKDFDPTNFTAPTHEDLVDITSGDISFSLTPTMVDLGSDVNNLHGVYKELQYLSGWSGAQLTYTSLKFDADTFRQNIGAADISGNKISPRMYLKSEDFQNITWIGKMIGGGFVAIVLKSALSTNGISISASKDGKGTTSVTLTGFMSIEDQDSVPAEFYIMSADGVSVNLNKHKITVEVGETVTLKANTEPDGATVTWDSDNDDEATVTSGGVVEGVAEGTVAITASVTDNGHTATDTCIVTVVAAN